MIGNFAEGLARDSRMEGTLAGHLDTLPSVDAYLATMLAQHDYRAFEIVGAELTMAYEAFAASYAVSHARNVADTTGTCATCEGYFYRDAEEQTKCYTCEGDNQ
jgi:DnaJ-class molecular chaperone